MSDSAAAYLMIPSFILPLQWPVYKAHKQANARYLTVVRQQCDASTRIYRAVG